MARRMSSTASPVSQTEVAELLPLLPTLSKALARRGHEVPAAIKNTWHQYGLAPRHMNLLITVALVGPLSVSDLSARLGIGLATASLLVGELGRVGLLARTEDESDRRRTIVDLAPGQRQAIGAFVAKRAGVIQTALETLEPAERAALIKGLRAIVTALETLSVEEPQPARPRR